MQAIPYHITAESIPRMIKSSMWPSPILHRNRQIYAGEESHRQGGLYE